MVLTDTIPCAALQGLRLGLVSMLVSYSACFIGGFVCVHRVARPMSTATLPTSRACMAPLIRWNLTRTGQLASFIVSVTHYAQFFVQDWWMQFRTISSKPKPKHSMFEQQPIIAPRSFRMPACLQTLNLWRSPPDRDHSYVCFFLNCSRYYGLVHGRYAQATIGDWCQLLGMLYLCCDAVVVTTTW